ncbi:MAG: decarboxylating 6-phosphogluconate dehydrogenase [Patescibacteria group bacterium]|nr:decarboxylating 6-phosphogluconate dehydrogenase [Patescibacteria group bacterium]
MQVGLIGLGKMGSRMATKLIKEKHELVVWNRTQTAYDLLKSDLSDYKFDIAVSLEELVKKLQNPRVIWIMLPAGETTQNILDEVSGYLKEGDIIIDGGNSNYKDTQERFKKLTGKGILFLGIGVSGGIIAAKEGYPIMVGGSKKAYEHIIPILDSLSKPSGGHEYFGEGGAGHFIKMVHNAIEYGIMQSIGEGFGLLDNSEYSFDLQKVAKLYQKGTLVSGFMMERTIEVLEKDPKLSKIAGVIGKASGETIWAVEEAKKKNLPIEIIQRSLEIRNESETDPKIQKSFAAKMVAALRNAFGGHSVSQA